MPSRTRQLRRSLYHQLTFHRYEKKQSRLQTIIFALILFSVLWTVLETENSLYLPFKLIFDIGNYLIALLFSVEYLIRLWVCVESPLYRGRGGRLRYIFSLWALVDLLAIIPFIIIGGAASESFLFRILRAFRIVALAKFGRYSKALNHVLYAINEAKFELFLCVVMTFGLLIFFSTLMFLVEGKAQPEAFGSIPRCIWWAAVTLTTVGYGDYYPMTVVGKIVGVFASFAAIAVLALPAGILSSTFMASVRHTKRK